MPPQFLLLPRFPVPTLQKTGKDKNGKCTHPAFFWGGGGAKGLWLWISASSVMMSLLLLFLPRWPNMDPSLQGFKDLFFLSLFLGGLPPPFLLLL